MKTPVVKALLLLVVGSIFSADAEESSLPGLALEMSVHLSARPTIAIDSSEPFRFQLPLPERDGGIILFSDGAVVKVPSVTAQSSTVAPSLHAEAVTTPIIMAIEVNYPNASEKEKKAVLTKIRAKVGLRYSDRVVEEDIRTLTKAIQDVKRVRIFGEPMDGGVRLIVAIQPNSAFDFNIGYQF